MSRDRLRQVSFALAAAACAVSCGKKGPPLPPLVVVPARIQDVAVRRLASETAITFTLPKQNQDNTSPADLARVEVYAISGQPVDAQGRTLDGREFRRYAALVAEVEVEPPPKPVEDGATPPENPPPTVPDDPRPAQGEIVTVREAYNPSHLVPFVHPDVAKRKPRPPVVEPRPVPLALGWPGPPQPLSRSYYVVSVNRKGQYGGLSPRVAVPLTDLPPAPTSPEITVTEQAISVAWQPPAGVRQRISATATATELTARIILTGATPHTYNLYTWPGTEPAPAAPTPVNPTPIDTPGLGLASPVFGVPRCYAVRSLEVVGRATLEGPLSPPTCITPADTFAPQAPRNLATVGSEGGVSLIWDPNSEADLDGYLVLRGAAPNDPSEVLTPAPLEDTLFTDTTATPGVRYVYAIVAVDIRGNRSGLSNRMEESAR